MAVDIYLSINNGEEKIHFPVTPPEITITTAQGSETFETSGYGFVRIIGSPELQGISWESFFPVHEYSFVKDDSMRGQEYADKINNWRRRRLPLRLVITSSNTFANLDVNIACTVSQLKGSVRSNGDYNYSIQFDEVDLLNQTLNGEELTVAQYEEIMQRISALEERTANLENVMIYNYMDDNMPEWAKPTIQKLMDKGYLNGTGDNELGLTMEMIRLLVVVDNAGAFDNGGDN